MPSGIEDVLLLKLAPVIVGGLVKGWVGDSAILDQATTSVGDMLKATTLPRLERRRVERELEAVGERIVERLQPFLSTGAIGGVPEYEIGAAIAEAAETLKVGFASWDVALEANLEPQAIEDAVRRSRPDAVIRAQLAPKARVVYDFVIRESSAYLAQMIVELPAFVPAALTELLARSATLEHLLTEALEALPSAGELTASDFETRYRRAVVNKLDWMTLLGLGGANRAAQRYALSVAYVSLGATVDAAHDAIWDEVDDADGEDTERRSADERVLRVDRLISRHPWVVIEGVAGSGKTTILQWLAVRAATRSFDASLERFSSRIPVFVRLRDYSDRALPGPERLADDVAGIAADLRPQNWSIELLYEGQMLVLVDGMDELPADRRDEAVDWLRDLAENFPLSRYVVTSRPGVIDTPPGGFAVARLSPMTLTDIDRFVEHWHRAVAIGAPSAAARDRLTNTAEALRQSLRLEAPLRRLATNPLMCAAVCALHEGEDTSLPRSRSELYAIALDMLLDRRDRARRLTTEDYGLSKPQKTLLLQDVAWWMIRNGYTEVVAADVHARLSPLLIRMKLEGTPDEVLRYLIERTGLLRSPAVDHVDFVHKTFMEYLAAFHAVAEKDVGVLVRNAHDVAFHEVVVLAMAAPGSPRDLLVSSLLERARSESRWTHALTLLAAQCVDVAPDLDAGLRAEVDALLGSLIPPRRVGDAEQLATAGDVAVPMLPYRKDLSLDQARASARALIRIATPSAMSQLRGYGADRRIPVVRELIAGWNAFDREEFAREVMHGSTFLDGSLVIEQPGSLGFLRWLEGLEDLEIRADGDVDLAGLQRARTLRSLYVTTFPDLWDLDLATALPQLCELRIGSAPDLTVLGGIGGSSLRRLYLDDVPRLEEFDVGREPAEALEDLRIRRAPAGNLGPLAAHPALRRLLLELPFIETLEPLEGMDALRELELVGTDNDLDLHWLTASVALRSLRLRRYKGDVTFEPFGRASDGLKSLILEECPGAISIRSLGVIGDVLELSLIGLPLTSLSGLPRVVGAGLTGLTIADCPITSLFSIPRSIERVALTSVPVSDLTPLKELPKLKRLTLSQLPLLGLTALRGCEQLESLRLGPMGDLRDLDALRALPELRWVDPGPYRSELERLGVPTTPAGQTGHGANARRTLVLAQ